MKKIGIFASSILLISYSILLYYLITFKLLSNTLFIIIFSIYSLITLLLIIIDFIKNKSLLKKISLIFRILFIISNIILIYNLYITNKFINNITTKEEYNIFYLISNKDNIEVTGILNDINENVLSNIDNTNIKTYFYYEDLYEDLINSEIDSILISSSTSYILESTYSDFFDNYKIIKEIKLLKEVSTSNISIKDNTFTLLISGLDRSGNISNVSRSDVNILMTVNTSTSEVLLNAIPRDYYVTLHSKNAKDKLTHSGIYGIDETVNTISDLLDIEIDYYIKVNFDTVSKLVDIMNGITIYSDKDLSFCNIHEGNNDVNGACALRFARERHSYKTGDRHRGENQEEVIRAIISKFESNPSLIAKYNKILSTLENNIQTNIPSNTIKELVELQLNRNSKWNITTYNLNGSDASDYTYSYGSSRKLYVMKPNYDTVNHASLLIKEMKNNKTSESMGE